MAVRRRPLPADDARHGTANGYNNYGCRCEACTNAIREYNVPRNRAWRHRTGRFKPRAVYLAEIEAAHGTESRYKRCHCDECRAGSAAARRERRRKAKTA